MYSLTDPFPFYPHKNSTHLTTNGSICQHRQNENKRTLMYLCEKQGYCYIQPPQAPLVRASILAPRSSSSSITFM
ncbi:hypothetical protein Hdeb2414_s0009g00316891 [Helianthus debilis subsp. tardiflorus]